MSSEGKRWTILPDDPVGGRPTVEGPAFDSPIEVVPASEVERLQARVQELERHEQEWSAQIIDSERVVEALRKITRHGRSTAALREIARAALADERDR